ncbi:hypothetical protein DESC_720451 [Desulfosarcina cetonica]|nr:hypothetical protein DESC_720451 [Desulfosarcina cetonica]
MADGWFPRHGNPLSFFHLETGNQEVQRGNDFIALIFQRADLFSQRPQGNTGDFRRRHHHPGIADMESRVKMQNGLSDNFRIDQRDDHAGGQVVEQRRLYIEEIGHLLIRLRIGILVDIELGHQKRLRPSLKTPLALMRRL